jgi:hypothetical protein
MRGRWIAPKAQDGGVLFQLALHAPGPAVRQTFEIGLQRQQAFEASQDLMERSTAAGRVLMIAVDEDERQACDLAGAFVDELLETVFSRGDLTFEDGAGFGRGFKLVAEGGDVVDEAVDEVARDFPEPRHGIQREEDAHKGEEEFDHRREYAPGLRGWGFV